MLYWFKEFQHSHTSVFDEEHQGRQIEGNIEEMIEKVHGIVFINLWIEVREIVDIIGISCEHVNNVIHEHLCMKSYMQEWWYIYSQWFKNAFQWIFLKIFYAGFRAIRRISYIDSLLLIRHVFITIFPRQSSSRNSISWLDAPFLGCTINNSNELPWKT